MGSIIVCDTPDGLYELIDGQQRITTIYLLLCSIRDSLSETGTEIQKLHNQISATDIDSDGNDIFRHRVKLQYTDSYGLIEKIADRKEIDKVPETSSAENLNQAYEKLMKCIEDEFGIGSASVTEIRKFYAYLESQVILVRVKTETRMDALRIFATINNRGVRLEPTDLVKNLMFMEARKSEFERLSKKWKKMINELHKSKEKVMQFMRYFILANYGGSDLLKGDIYEWLSKNKNQKYYAKEPLKFVDRLLSSAENYIRFTKGEDTKGLYNPHITNIRIMSRSARMPFMILMAGSDLPPDLFNDLCKNVETYFSYIC